MADGAELDAVWRQTVAEFDRGLTIARGLLKRGQFAQAMAAVEQCQALLGVMDGLQQRSRLVPVDELARKVRLAFGMPDSPEEVERAVDAEMGGRDV